MKFQFCTKVLRGISFVCVVLGINGTTRWLISYHLLIHAAAQFALSRTITVNAESVDGLTPSARVTWSTTIPPECVASLRVDFRTQSQSGMLVATYNTTNTSQTEVIQTDLQCATNYFITVVATGIILDGIHPTLTSSPFQVLIGGKKNCICIIMHEFSNLVYTIAQIYQPQLESVLKLPLTTPVLQCFGSGHVRTCRCV